MSHKHILSLLAVGLLAFTSTAQDNTLARWTFQNVYDQSKTDAGILLTPTSTPYDMDETVTGWFRDGAPLLFPEEYAGEQSAYVLTADSENRYWQLCKGYETRVFRIENDNASNDGIDFTDPSQHKAYYEISFSTKGYKGISIEFAIAPGNNTQTPIQAVVSTDGGTTWASAGTLDTSAVWFQYETRTLSISANDKEKVLVRLVPTVGTTNWNMSFLNILAADKVQSGAVNAPGTVAKWSLDKGTDSSLSPEVSTEGVFSVATFSYGSNLVMGNTRTDGNAISATQFQPIEGNNGEDNEANALTFTLKPKKGLNMRPVSLSFQASKVGTNGGAFDVGVKAGAADEVFVARDVNPQLVKEAPHYSLHQFDLTSLGDASEGLTACIYIKNLANNKQYAFQNVILTVDVEGEIVPVPVYTFSMNLGTPGAGTLSCVPGGAEFDEGTILTVSASENFGYHFEAWTDADGKIVSEANPYTFEITGNTSLTATYSSTPVYALNLDVEGGANSYLVQFMPEGNVVDGIHYYEEGTDVSLSATGNRILTFTNWEDNTTAPERIVKMDGEKSVTATYSAADYIVGWDFYYDQPSSERAADYKDETDNAGLLSLRNPEGKTTSWLTRGISNGAENGKWGARIWKYLTDQNYFELSFSTVGYSNIKVAAALGVSYNSYSTINAQWSADGKEFTDFGTYTLAPGWVSEEFDLPAEAAGLSRIWIRYMPDRTSPLVGNSSDYDGLCIAELFVLADKDSANDETAPSIISIIPADGSEGASATGSVIVTFDEKIKAGSGTATLNGEALEMTISGKNAVFPYSGLDYATTYTFTLPAGVVTDRSGNPSAEFTSKFTTLERVQPEARLYDAIVAADGSGDYTSVQSAIDAAPAGRVKPWLIFVKNGEYKGHVDIPKSKPMLHIIGQDRDKTIILDDKLCGGPNALHVSVGATVVVNSNDCLFENITLENSYGHEKKDGPQALALNTSGDRTIFNNVAMLSYQDTWITPSTSNYRAYVRNSLIEGAVDFIYNSGNIFIDNTTLYIIRKSGGYIVAPSHAADVKWGYVFNNCTITAPGVPSETSVWLGRPWHNAPKTVFLNTRAEVTIPATGWYETMGGLPAIWADWNTVDADGNPVDLSQRRDTYYYTDANGNRIYGTAKNHLTDEEAATYTIANVLSGNDSWQPVVKTEACEAPVPVYSDGKVSWESVPYAICYVLTRGDELLDIVTETEYPVLAREGWEDISVRAVNEFGGLSAEGKPSLPTAINEISAGHEGKIIGIYDLQGRAMPTLTKGANLVRTLNADGSVTTTKVVR